MHPSAKTTLEIRAAIQQSDASVRALARTYGVNPKTVQKWRHRTFTEDAPSGRKRTRNLALSPAEEAMCVGFRKHALLPLDDCLYALQWRIPHLSRSSLHRLFWRHGISRLPELPLPETAGPGLGEFYLDAATVRTGDGLVTLLIAFDRTSKLAHAGVFEPDGADTGAVFLADLMRTVPYRIHTILTSRDELFTDEKDDGAAHPFAGACRSNGIAHKLAPKNDAWTIWPGGVSRPAGRGKAGRPAYRTRAHLRDHFIAFFDTYNRTRRLKTLNGLTPQAFIRQCRITEPVDVGLSPK